MRHLLLCVLLASSSLSHAAPASRTPLDGLKGEANMVSWAITSGRLAQSVSSWTGRPVQDSAQQVALGVSSFGNGASGGGIKDGPDATAPAFKSGSETALLPPVSRRILSNLQSRVGEVIAVASLPPIGRSISNCARDLAYSFDGGPAPWHTSLDDVFARSGGAYTAFLNGATADGGCIYDEENVAMLRASLNAGHLLASATWSGARLSELTQPQIDVEIEQLEDALWKTLGVVPAFVRPPHGACDAACVSYLRERHGLSVVTWDTDSRDGAGASPMSSIDVLSGCTYPEPHMPLAHELFESSVDEVAATMAPRYRAMGYELLTVQQCLGHASAYKAVGAPQLRDETWTCEGKTATAAGWGDL